MEFIDERGERESAADKGRVVADHHAAKEATAAVRLDNGAVIRCLNLGGFLGGPMIRLNPRQRRQIQARNGYFHPVS